MVVFIVSACPPIGGDVSSSGQVLGGGSVVKVVLVVLSALAAGRPRQDVLARPSVVVNIV